MVTGPGVAAKACSASRPYPSGPPTTNAEPSTAAEQSSVRRRADQILPEGRVFVSVMIASPKVLKPFGLLPLELSTAYYEVLSRALTFVSGKLIRCNPVAAARRRDLRNDNWFV